MNAICALLNSHEGGMLVLRYERAPPKQHVVECVRMIEQRVKDLTSCTTVANLTLDVRPQQLLIMVKNSTHLITMNYNLHLPSESQVMSLPPSEPIQNVEQILNIQPVHSNENLTPQSHCRDFVIGQHAELRESKRVVLKQLKSSPSKCVTLADRITGRSNKFTSYVSAFANHLGGHIYYGINDDGVVEGEEITEKDTHEIVKKVTNAINKMIWPARVRGLQRGNHWDIYFEPVRDTNGCVIPGTYVIVVYVAQCQGGVFSEKPECYHIVEGLVEKMSFHSWSTHITQRSTPVPPHHPPIMWSSGENRKIFRELTSRLVNLRNSNKIEEFKNLSEFSMKMFPRSNASLVVLSEKIILACKKHHFEKAELLLEEYKKSLESPVDDYHIFKVKELYLRSRIESAKGNYDKSYEIASDGLQQMQHISAEFITVWFYIHAAMMAIIISRNENDSQKRNDITKQAKAWLDKAKRDAKLCQKDYGTEMTADLQQKLHISFATIHLVVFGSSSKQGDSCTNIEAAEAELELVRTLSSNGHPLTSFRHIQNLLVWCTLFYWRSHRFTEQEKCVECLKQAYTLATEAKNLARECDFEEMVYRANSCLADVTEKIVRINSATFIRKRVSLVTL